MYINERGYKPPYIGYIYKQNVREKDAVMSSAGVRLAVQDSTHGETLMHIQQSKSVRRRRRGVAFFVVFPSCTLRVIF